MALNATFQNLGARETSTVTGLTVKRALGTSSASGNSAQRTGVLLCNHDSSLFIFAKLVAANAALPTISPTDHDYKVSPGATLAIAAGAGIDVCIVNSSGGSSTAAYTALELK